MAADSRSRLRSALGPGAVAYVRRFPDLPFAGRAAVLANSYLRDAEIGFRTETMRGRRFVGNTRDFIQRYVYLFGVWQPDVERFIVARLRPGDVFVDVGANVGYFSLLAAGLVDDEGGVVAVEASPAIFEGLQANLDASPALAARVRALNVAATESAGVRSVYRGDDDLRGITTTVASHGLELECQIEGAPLDDLLTEDEIRRVRLVKVDVEGGEGAVLQGLVKLLETGRDDLELIVEAEPATPGKEGPSAEDVVTFLARYGFCAYELPSDYTLAGHLRGRRRGLAAPERLDDRDRADVTDLIFSRRDSDRLEEACC